MIESHSTSTRAPILQVGAGPAFPTRSVAIRTIDLAKRYRSTTALDGLTMEVPRGEIFGFLGPNGAGKTTAVKLLLGLVRPTGGEAWVLGEPIGDRLTRRHVGYLPELFRYQDWMTAREVLHLHCRLAGMPGASHASATSEALHTVGLASRAHDRVATYSKGMQQRLGLGVALLGSPQLIFLDEPTSALDPVGRHDVREIIRGIKARGGTVFLNSHLLSEVEQVCDRVAVVDHGRVIAMGSMDDLRGAEHQVRLRLGTVGPRVERAMDHFGSVERDGAWYVMNDVPSNHVPALVVELVRAGAEVYAVESVRHSLEDRFLELLGGVHGDSHDRTTDSA